MSTRRNFLIGASAALMHAPAIVRAQSLMPLRGIIFPIERDYYGFVDRLYVGLNLPKIKEWQGAGLSIHEIAEKFNRCGRSAMNGSTWDAEKVVSVIRRDERIRRSDVILRKERGLL